MILSKKTICKLKGKLQRSVCYLTVIFLPAITWGADPVDR